MVTDKLVPILQSTPGSIQATAERHLVGTIRPSIVISVMTNITVPRERVGRFRWN